MTHHRPLHKSASSVYPIKEIDPKLDYRQLLVRLTPMWVVAWTRVYAIVLPGLIESFELNLAEAGQFIATIECGSFLSMMALALFIERLGAVRVLLIGLPTVAVALLLVTIVTPIWILYPCLVLLGSGMAWTATGINTLMAATGKRRAYYLGILHSFFSACAVVAPLVAGAFLAAADWQTYYRMVAVLALVVGLFVWWNEAHGEADSAPDEPLDGNAKLVQGQQRLSAPGPGNQWNSSARAIATVCLGVTAMTVMQGSLNTWSYLYVQEVYHVNHQQATIAPTVFWMGILVGRLGLIPLSRRWSCRSLLIVTSLLPSTALLIERSCGSYVVALAALFTAGLGVSGSFQLGTAWASERIPDRVGTASTAVMASAWLGIGCGPWLTGVFIQRSSYASVGTVVVAASALAVVAFVLTRPQPRLPADTPRQQLPS